MGQSQSSGASVLALAPFLLSPLISLATYAIARRRLQEGQDSSSRAHLFYRIISYMLLGQFLGHIVWNGTLVMRLLTPAGYFVLDTLFAVGRVWHTNPNLMGQAPLATSEDILMNRERGEDHSVLVSSNVSALAFQQVGFAVLDWQKDLRTRRWILGILFGLFLVISLIDGLELVVVASAGADATTENMVALILSYYAHVASLSFALYGAMYHARIQRIEKARWRMLIWAGLTLASVLTIGTSSIMLLSGTLSRAQAQALLTHPALIAFYGLAAGFLLRVQQYFHAVKMESIDRWDTFAGVVVALVTIAECMATSVYL